MSRGLTWLVAGATLSAYAATGAIAAEPKRSRDPNEFPRELPRGSLIIGGPDGQNHVFVRSERGGRAEQISTLLQLRPEQQPALAAYLDASRSHRGPHARLRPADDRHQTTPERLAEMERELADQQVFAKDRIAATRVFYAQLDARQKKVFDDMPMMLLGPGLMTLAMTPGGLTRAASFEGVEVRFGDMPEPPAPPPPPEPPAPPRPPSV